MRTEAIDTSEQLTQAAQERATSGNPRRQPTNGRRTIADEGGRPVEQDSLPHCQTANPEHAA